MASAWKTLSVLPRLGSRLKLALGGRPGLGQPLISCVDLQTGAACSIDNGSAPIRPSRERVPHGRA
jgi:hypothetical protein